MCSRINKAASSDISLKGTFHNFNFFTTGIDNIYIRIAVFSLTVLFAVKGNFINTKKVPVVTLNLNLNGR